MKISKIFNKLVFTLLFLFLLSQESFALTVMPSTVELKSTPGSQETFGIKVRNDESTKQIIKCYFWDLSVNKAGKVEYRAIGGFPYSLAKYIKSIKTDFSLAPNEIKEIFFTLSVPNDIKGGKQAIIFVQSLPDVKKTKGKSFVFSTRIALPVFLNIKGTEIIKSKIKSIEIKEPSGKEPLTISLDVVNTGNVYIKNASATISVVSDDYSTFIGSIKDTTDFILPQATKTLKGELNRSISAGKYRALITYQYEDKNIVIEKPFDIK